MGLQAEGALAFQCKENSTFHTKGTAPSGAAHVFGTGIFRGTATSAAPFEGAGLDRVLEGPGLGASAAVLAF